MYSLLEKYKGVILLIVVLVGMSNFLSYRVQEINKLDETNTIAYYEK